MPYKGRTVLLIGIIGYQLKSPETGMCCLFLSCRSVGSYSHYIQTITIALSYPPELGGKTLLWKTAHT